MVAMMSVVPVRSNKIQVTHPVSRSLVPTSELAWSALRRDRVFYVELISIAGMRFAWSGNHCVRKSRRWCAR